MVGAGGFGLILFIAVVGQPLIVACGLLVGMAARRWWHLLPGAVAAPVVHQLCYPDSLLVEGGALVPLVIAGGLWSVAAFGVRRAWAG